MFLAMAIPFFIEVSFSGGWLWCAAPAQRGGISVFVESGRYVTFAFWVPGVAPEFTSGLAFPHGSFLASVSVKAPALLLPERAE